MFSMAGADKPIVWLHGEIRTPPFSAEARIETGMLLRRLQRGERLSIAGLASDADHRSPVS